MSPFCLLTVASQWLQKGSFREKPVLNIQQGGVRQSKNKLRATHCCLMVRKWNERFLKPCVFYVKFAGCSQLCVYLSGRIPIFLHIPSEECMDITGALGSSVVCFQMSCSPPSLNQLSSHGERLRSSPAEVSCCLWAADNSQGWCCVLGQQQPWLFSATTSVASWRCLPWGIISRVEAIFFPRNRKKRRGWDGRPKTI